VISSLSRFPHNAASSSWAPHAAECSRINRRTLLVGAGVLGVGLSVSAAAQQLSAMGANALVPAFKRSPAKVRAGRRIDVHHHPAPPAYLAAVGAGSGEQLKSWSVQKALEDMDTAGIATAMLSIAAAGLWPHDVMANRRTARACNEFMARMASDYPGRFGVFATLPLGDVQGSLEETAYVLDILKADGVGLFTSYHNRWLGDPAFDPVFEELNRRGALVYTHPTVADCCAKTVPGVSPAVIEYGTDTSRAIASWVFGGSGNRFRDLTLIFSHAGGTMPFLIQRFEQEARVPANASKLPNGTLPLLRRYFYDTAQATNPVALGALMQIVPAHQVLFGTDFPYRSSAQVVAGLKSSHLSSTELDLIYRDNALRLFPRLARVEATQRR
jgi:predicted TIM-barrel fold metal-dependent hydrolase